MASRRKEGKRQYTALIQGAETSEGNEAHRYNGEAAAEVELLDSSSDDEGLLSPIYNEDSDKDTHSEFIYPPISSEDYEPPFKIRCPLPGGTSHGDPSRKTSQTTPDTPETSTHDSATSTHDSATPFCPNIDEDGSTMPRPYDFQPARKPGPVLDANAPWSPLQLFQLFFSSTSINTIIQNTNLNASRRIQEGKKYKWTPLTLKEFYNFLSIVIYCGLCVLHQFSDYWRKSFPYNHPFPGNVMSRCRFEAILWSLHLSDPADDEENDKKKNTPGYDALCKIKPLYTDIQTACMAYFHPDRDITFEERMVSLKALDHVKQHHKAKPNKLGYKLYVLADSSTAYTWNFLINEGKNPPQTLAMSMLPIHLLGSGYKLYLDNVNTTPGLLTDLQNYSAGACETIIRQKSVKNGLPENAKGGERRKVKRQENGHVSDAVAECNKFTSFYTVQHKTMKWYKTFFYHFLDIAVVNSHILHKELCKKRPDLQPMTQKNFREALVKELVEFAKDGVPDTVTSEVTTCMPVFIGEDAATQTRKFCRLCFNAGDKRIKASVQCRKCLVALCFNKTRNCFRDWHDETAV